MEAPFRVIISIIIALALLVIFFTYLAPLYVWPKNPEKQISEALLYATFFPGKAIEAKETVFDSGMSLSVTAFREQNLELKFECNSADDCCDKGVSCGNAVEWNERSLSFKQKRFIRSFARCNTEHNIAACTVYVGQKPAQVEIVSVQALEEMDLLRQGKYNINLIVKNSGNVIAPGVFAKAKLYKVREDKTREDFSEANSGQIELMPNEQGMIPIDFEINVNGNYEAEIRVGGENSGFDTNTIRFRAINAPVSLCRALDKGGTLLDSASGKCETTFYCANCMLAFECREAWEKKEPQMAFTEADAAHALAIAEPENGSCPAG